MYKTIIKYASFTFAIVVVVGGFITATNYMQLGVAMLLYPLLAWFAYNTFIAQKSISVANQPLIVVRTPDSTAKNVEDALNKNIEISDSQKRDFLKLIGVAGVSLVAYSILNKRVQLPKGFMGTQQPATESNRTQPKSSGVYPINEYRISEIDEDVVSYFGFVHQDGGWYIMKQDTSSGEFRYTKGTANFATFWKNRKELNYVYFDEAFKS